MKQAPERVIALIAYLAQLPANHHVTALCFEDPIGELHPGELKVWTARLRRTVDLHRWNLGNCWCTFMRNLVLKQLHS